MEKAQIPASSLEGLRVGRVFIRLILNTKGMNMNLEFVLLSYSQRGRVFRHDENLGKICLMFNNITQCFDLSDFYRLKKTVEGTNMPEFFGRHGNETPE